MNKFFSVMAIVVSILVAPVSASANTVGFNCKYPNYSNLEGLQETTGNHTLIFNYDSDTGKTMFTFMDVSSFTREVTHIGGEGFITFVDVSPAGNVLTVAVVTQGPYTGQSVYSKAPQFVPNGPLTPSQYYGTCTII